MLDLTLQLLAQDLVGQLGIRLTAGLLHQLSDEETLQLGLATTEGLHLIGMGPQQLIDNGFNRSRIADHAEAALVDDRLG